MANLTVRKASFQFPDELDDIFPGDDIEAECYLAAFSLTMPVLEPYLIRTYRALADRITDPELADDVQHFIQQEAQHHKNHARVNAIIHERLGPEVAAELKALEDRLDRDYRRYNATKSHRFNALYAEGFEAMTCAMAVSMMERASKGEGFRRFGSWQQLWAWHAAEEIEHRTVAFGVYEHLHGGYLRRVWGSMRAQVHFGLCVARLERVLLAANGRPAKLHMPSWWKHGRRRFLATYHWRYDPAAIEPPALVSMVLAGIPAKPT